MNFCIIVSLGWFMIFLINRLYFIREFLSLQKNLSERAVFSCALPTYRVPYCLHFNLVHFLLSVKQYWYLSLTKIQFTFVFTFCVVHSMSFDKCNDIAIMTLPSKIISLPLKSLRVHQALPSHKNKIFTICTWSTYLNFHSNSVR